LLALPWTRLEPADNPTPKDRKTEVRLRRPVALALVEDGQRLLVANRDSGTLAVVDTSSRAVLSEIRVGQRLSDLILTPGADRVLVTDEAAGELVVLSRQADTLREVRRFTTGLSPVSVSVRADGRQAAVACLWPRQLMLFDLTGDNATAPTVVDLPFAPRAQLAIDNKLVVADSFGGQLALVDLQRQQVDSVRSLPIHNIRGLALDQARKHLLLTHQMLHRQGHPNATDIRSGSLVSNHVRQLKLTHVLNPADYLSHDEELYQLGDVEEGAGDPAAVVAGADGSLLVAFAGVHELAIGWPHKVIWTRLPVGQRPTAIAVDAAAQKAYVANTFADSISVIDLSTAKVSAEIRLGRLPELTPAERGELLFFDARLSLDGWYSCHSCHSDGHSSGQLNDNFTDGSFGTPKRVLSLLGVKDSAPWAWNGQMKELAEQVRQSLTSTMQGPEPKTADVAALTAYLQTLSPPPALAQARGKTDRAARERGRQMFTDLGCVGCHKPPLYTTARTYDVGLRDEAGETKFNPPSLRGVSQG
jgi:YVTN family beta-propeller protein